MAPIEQLDQADVRPPKGVRPPIIGPGQTLGTVTDRIAGIVLTKHTPVFWILIVAAAAGLVGMLQTAIAYLLAKGVGIWGINIPVGWGFAIVNFVWWIGIGHAGTLISAILLLFKQSWRTSINRFAEAMTIFAVMQAGLFPLIHTGRPWLAAYWLFPIPLTMGVWPQFRSPLIWDVFAVSTYFTVSFLFWGIGLIPDFATLRDSAKTLVVRRIYGMLAMGWRGSGRHWARYETAYLLLAGLSTPLVLSVHSVVSWDFAMALVPGWHATLFAPYFVAGAIYSGVGLVITLLVPIRRLFHLEEIITVDHFENLAKLCLLTGSIVGYAYVCEYFMAWYSGNPTERAAFWYRAFGPYWWATWTMIICNGFLPLLLWVKKIRTNITALFVISIFVNVGMWFERYVIIVVSLAGEPYTRWTNAVYNPTWADWGIMAGSFGWFFMWFLLFVKNFPAVSISEVKEVLAPPRSKTSKAHG